MHSLFILLCCVMSYVTVAQEAKEQSKSMKQLFRRNSKEIAEEISPRLIKLSPVLTSMLEDIDDIDEEKSVIEFPVTQEANKKLKNLYPLLESADEYAVQKKMNCYNSAIIAELFNIGEKYEISLLAKCALNQYVRYLKTPEHLKQFVTTYKPSQNMSYNPHALNNLEPVRGALNCLQQQYGDPESTGNHAIDDLTMDDFDMNGCDFINNNTFIFSNSRDNYKQFDIPTKKISAVGNYWTTSNNTVIFITHNGCIVDYKNKVINIDGTASLMPFGISKDGSYVLLQTTEQCMVLDCTKNAVIPLEKSNFVCISTPTSILPTVCSKGNCFSPNNTYVMVADITQNIADRKISLYKTQTGELVHQLPLNNEESPRASFTKDETHLVCVRYTDGKKPNTVTIYNMQTAQTTSLPTTIDNRGYRLHPHKNQLVIRYETELQIWDITNNTLLHTMKTPIPLQYWEISPDGNYLLENRTNDTLHCYDINSTTKKIWQYKLVGFDNDSFAYTLDPSHNTIHLFKYKKPMPTDSHFPNDPNCSHELHLCMDNLIGDIDRSVLLDMGTGTPINKPFAHLPQLRITTLTTSRDRTKAVIGNLQCHNGTHPEVLTILDCNQLSLLQALTIALLLHNENNPNNRIKFAHNPAIKALFYSLPESIQKLHTIE